MFRALSTPALSQNDPQQVELQSPPHPNDHAVSVTSTPPAGHQSPPSHPPDRVFQIIKNDEHRHLLFSWPPMRTGMDYDAEAFARLGRRITVEDPDEDGRVAEGHGVEESGVAAKTSCTRRFSRLEEVTLGHVAQVECVYIPHGKQNIALRVIWALTCAPCTALVTRS